MAQLQDNSLDQRIADLEASVRSLLSAAAVGGTSVAATDPASVTLTGTANTPLGVVPWQYNGPTVELFVSGGRLRIDLAAAIEVTGAKAEYFLGYRVIGPSVDQAGLASAPVRIDPTYATAYSVRYTGQPMAATGNGGTFDLVTGLPIGWYRIVQAQSLSYGSDTGIPNGFAQNRRLAVTRY